MPPLKLPRPLLVAPPSGGEGALVNDFGTRLRLNMKRNEPRLKELEARFGMKRTTVNKASSASWRGRLGHAAAAPPAPLCWPVLARWQ